MTTKLVPNVYRQPLGLPLSWRDEQSGRLPRAINAYVGNRVDGTPLDHGDLELVRQYCEHYINAPCWDIATFEDEESHLASLRLEIAAAKTADALSAWIHRCLDLGIDPL